MSLSQVEKANLIFGLILSELYSKFPIPATINIDTFHSIESEFSAKELNNMFHSCVNWLKDEGYIRYESVDLNNNFRRCVLAEKGLTAINGVPEAFTPKQTFGEKLQTSTKEISKEGGKKIIIDVVGQIFGAVVKDRLGL